MVILIPVSLLPRGCFWSAKEMKEAIKKEIPFHSLVKEHSAWFCAVCF